MPVSFDTAANVRPAACRAFLNSWIRILAAKYAPLLIGPSYSPLASSSSCVGHFANSSRIALCRARSAFVQFGFAVSLGLIAFFLFWLVLAARGTRK